MELTTSEWIILWGYAVMTLCGIIANALTVLVLRRLREKLGKALDPTTWRLMLNMAYCDVAFCVIACVMVSWNRFAEHGWPFSVPFMCYYLMVMIDLNNVSGLHMFVIALLRAMAVFLPSVFSRVVTKGGWIAKFIVYCAPWFCGTVESVCTFIAGDYRVRYDEKIHFCFQVPYASNDDVEGKKVLERLRTITGMFYIVLPFGVGALLYVAILSRLSLRRRHRRTLLARQQLQFKQPTNATTTTVALVDSVQERQYRAVKVVAWSLAVQMLFVLPGFVAYFFVGLDRVPVNLHLIFGVYCSAFLMNPVVYAASSQEMRVSYVQLLRRSLCCWRHGKLQTAAAGSSAMKQQRTVVVGTSSSNRGQPRHPSLLPTTSTATTIQSVNTATTAVTTTTTKSTKRPSASWA